MSDWEYVVSEINGKPSKNIILFIKKISLYAASGLLFRIRRMEAHKNKDRKLLMLWQKKKIEKKYASYISPGAKIGYRVSFPHPTGVVIGDGVQIGDHSTIYQQVTLGGKIKGDMSRNNYPVIGKDVTIFAGAKILGDIVVGDGAVIGANSVVTKSIEAESVYAGVPAKRIDNNRR